MEPLSREDNDSIPEGSSGARFINERSGTHTTSQWLSQNGWTAVTSETGYLAKKKVELGEQERVEWARSYKRSRITTMSIGCGRRFEGENLDGVLSAHGKQLAKFLRGR